jgi:hypothetical protein
MLKKRERALEEPFPKKEKILSGFQNLEPIRRGAMIKSFQDLPFQPFSTLQIYQFILRSVLSFFLFLHSIKFTFFASMAAK